MPPPEDDSDDEFGFGPSPTSRGLGGGFGGGLSGGGLGVGLGVGLSDAPVMVLNSDLDAPQLISERELALSEVSSAVSATLASSEFSEVGSSEWNSPNPLHASAHHDAPPAAQVGSSEWNSGSSVGSGALPLASRLSSGGTAERGASPDSDDDFTVS